MNRRRIMLVGATVALAVSAVTTSLTDAVAAPAATASFCTKAGAIPASELAKPVSLQNCSVQGRLVVRSIGTVHMGVVVPATGRSVTNTMLTKSGDYQLTVINSHGKLSARTSSPVIRARRAFVSPDTDPACNETAWSPLGYSWHTTLKWYFNESTATSRAGLNGAAALAALRSGNNNLTTGQNNCGLPTGSFSSKGAYQSTTNKFANINSAGDCLAEDGQNTDSFGPFDDPNDLAQTCTGFDENNGVADESDTYFGSNVGLVTSCPSSGNKYDLETVATHEWGHSYGLDHVSAVNEVMYTPSVKCPNVRHHLGLGDWNGMDALYP